MEEHVCQEEDFVAASDDVCPACVEEAQGGLRTAAQVAVPSLGSVLARHTLHPEAEDTIRRVQQALMDALRE